MKPIRFRILDGVQLAIEEYQKKGDESKLRQKLGGLKGKYPLSYKNALLLK